jgi:signal transduction histidine kinase/DNA-binding response OmpR family regulator
MGDQPHQAPVTPRPGRPDGIHSIVRLATMGRAYAAATYALMILLTMPPQLRDWAGLIVVAALLYPWLVYGIAKFSGRSRTVGYLAFSTDGLICGAAIVLSGYAFVPSIVYATMMVAGAVIVGGSNLLVRSILPIVIVGSFAWPFVEADFQAHNDGLPLYLGLIIICVFLLYFAYLTNRTSSRLIAVKKSLQSHNRKVDSQARMLSSMNEVARVVNSTLDLSRVMIAIRGSISDVIDFDQEGLLFVDPSGTSLTLEKYSGQGVRATGDDFKNIVIPLDEKNSVFSNVVNNDRPIFVADVASARAQMSPSDAKIYDLSPCKSLIALPLSINEEVIGVLAFANSVETIEAGKDEIAALERNVGFIATAIRNARLYEKIKVAEKAANVANQAKSQFLANMSHELRTPMNAVIGYSEMLKEDAEDQGADDFIPDLDRICKASKHLLSLINDILDLSKVEADKIELYPETVDIAEFLDDVAGAVQPVIESNGNRLEIEDNVKGVEVVNDVTRLRQIVLNLLSNAAKFTHQGTVRLKTFVEKKNGVDWLNVQVTDSGIGMSDEQVEKVFQPFTQADASTTRKYGGTGLGLAISKSYCELMGGTIEVFSREGQGSTFTINIPADINKASAGELSEMAALDAIADSTQARDGSEKQSVVLVIDDDSSARDLLQRLLEREGYRVLTADRGKKGLEMARQYRPGVITLDALMPEMDGWTVLGALKEDPETAHIPVVMVSFVDEPGKGLALGAAEYMTKPVKKQYLLETLARLETAQDAEILVVEDDRNTREMLVSWLQKAGWPVHSAADGREGLEKFRQIRPSIVVLDLMMPEVDGFEFLGTLRYEYPDDESKVIVVTAKELFPEDIQRLNGSVEKIIEKSQAPGSQLITEIARHLSG